MIEITSGETDEIVWVKVKDGDKPTDLFYAEWGKDDADYPPPDITDPDVRAKFTAADFDNLPGSIPRIFVSGTMSEWNGTIDPAKRGTYT